VIFGHLRGSDRPQAALITTLLLTSLATFAVGFVPTYAQVGIWGAVILTIIRFIQGLGLGGVPNNSLLEWCATHRSHHLPVDAPPKDSLGLFFHCPDRGIGSVSHRPEGRDRPSFELLFQRKRA
jgi:hypothetical protein